MTKETMERIQKDAEGWADTEEGLQWYDMGQIGLEQSYMAGATIEHPKAWNDAIDKCISAIVNDEDILMNGSSLIEKLEALKL